MEEKDPHDMSLNELVAKVRDTIKWLDLAFDANCRPEEYDETCASCNAGAAVRSLRLIEKELTWITDGDVK